jgi:hypothetical protein
MLRIFLPILLAPCLLHAEADPVDLVKRQCRSVHLGYETPKSKAAYIEVIPQKSAPGTYFCALGFHMGYFGIQELADGKKIALFSIWEPENAVGDERVSLIEKGDAVLDQRFGGEGTGGQSRMEFPWETGKPVRFLAQAKPDGEFTEFSGHIHDPAQAKWRLMATFRTRSKGISLEGLYSFIEDFRRNYESAGIAREAVFQNGWVLGLDGKWLAMEKARFTGDVTPSTNIDAGAVPGGFFLKTGGDTAPKTTKLWETMTRTATSNRPDGLENLLRP